MPRNTCTLFLTGLDENQGVNRDVADRTPGPMTLHAQQKLFLVDWVLPEVNLADLEAAQHALEEAGRRLAAEGRPVSCLRSTYVPSQHRWLCLFEADTADAVRETHEIAQIPVLHVEEAVDLLLDERLTT
jgi:hypothetical protein